ncbi:MAG: HIT family protein [Actinomycetota bacterium]|nr:HIT family protein [Actinomycetota bacterium]
MSPVDVEEYHRRVRAGPCFLCDVVAGRLPHHVVHEDERAIAFLNRYPTVRGYVILAPKEHREDVTGDFTEEEYVELQRLVYRVGEAVRRAVPTERLYILTLGSKHGNAHVHWHVAPLPPGLPYEEQQLGALDWGASGERVLELSDSEQVELAASIRDALDG